MSAALSEDDELLAAELAFGLLDPAERRTAEALLGSKDAFADAHSRWQSYAAAMFDEPGEEPSSLVWRAIEARLLANDFARAPSTAVRWWRTGALTATAAAIVLGVVALEKPQIVVVRVPIAQPISAPLVAVLTGKTGFATVSFDPVNGRITYAANGLEIGHHSPELWVIPADGKPRAIGVMNGFAPGWGKMPAAAADAMVPGATIAVSVEPIGGSPTGQPTGSVILTGKLATT